MVDKSQAPPSATSPGGDVEGVTEGVADGEDDADAAGDEDADAPGEEDADAAGEEDADTPGDEDDDGPAIGEGDGDTETEAPPGDTQVTSVANSHDTGFPTTRGVLSSGR